MATRITRSDRPYVAVIVSAILLVLLAGFSRSFFFLPLFGTEPDWAAHEPIFYVHGAVFASWFAFFAYQSWLVRARSLRVHRKLGYFGVALGIAVVIVGCYAALRAANRPNGFMGVPFPAQQFLALPFSNMVSFAMFLSLATVQRHRPASHKRLMLLASISLLGAAVARIPLMFPQLPVWLDAATYAGFTVLLGTWDIQTRGRVRLETYIGGPALVLLALFALPFGATAAWQHAALWMMSFTGPP